MLNLLTNQRIIRNLTLATGFLLPLKFSLTLIPLSALTLSFLYSLITLRPTRDLTRFFWRVSPWSYLVIFTIYVALVSPFGVDPTRSIHAVFSKLSSLLLPLMIFWAASSNIDRTATEAPDIDTAFGQNLLLMVLYGQACAATHSLLEFGFPHLFTKWFLGPVTESGQLGMTIVLAVGQYLALPDKKSGKGLQYVAIILLLVAAILVNLKRGPWAGCIVGLTILALCTRHFGVILSLIIFVLLCCTLEPVRERIQDSALHFFIHGGRSELWEIGHFLHSQFPLGIGHNTSKVLHAFTDEVPNELTHFHSNPIHILVELGWIGTSLLVWWLANTVVTFFQAASRNIVLVSYACALISWQIAGLVEYNFGDSEVLYLALTIIGAGEVQRLGLRNKTG